VIKVGKVGCHSEAGFIVEESAVSPRLGTTRPTRFVRHRLAPFETCATGSASTPTRGKIPHLIPDFSNWKNQNSYWAAFNRLVASLKSPDSKTQ